MGKRKELEAIVSIAGAVDPSLQKSIANATKQFSGLKIGMAAVGTAVIAATTAIVSFGVDACKSAAAFETQIANVATLLDGTGEQVAQRTKELSADVLEVSNATGIATDELNDGLYQIISAVGDSEDAIDQMGLAAKAAAAGGSETTDAINLLTAVTKGYGDTSGDAFQKASDLSFMTVKLGQTSFPELAASMGKVVPLASALGVSQEELYGSFAALTGVTGSTAEVSTQMKAVMSGLMSPTQGMTDALKSLGYENANAALESLGLQGTLDALGRTVNGDTQALAKMFSSVEAQTAILALAGAQSEDFANKTAAMYEAAGATDNAFATQTDTLEYTIQAIKNLGANFKTSVGQAILPVVKDVAQKLLPVISTALSNLQPLLTGLFNKASPFIDLLGNLAASIFPVIQKMTASFFEAIGPADDLIPALGGALMALVPAVTPVMQALSPLVSMIGQMITAFLPALTQMITALTPILRATASAISISLSSLIQSVMPVVQNLTNIFTELCNFVTNVFTGNWAGAWESVKLIFSNCFQALVGLAKIPINAVISIINGVISGINNLGFTIPDWVPGIGGKGFELNVPLIPMLASGGFTTGPSIAGEAGTEAVISFNSAYRDENLSYWAKAGRMLGIDDDILTSFERGNTSTTGNINVEFAPKIIIHGSEDSKKEAEDIIKVLRREEEEFMDMLEEMLRRRGGDDPYVFEG